jgi:phosphoribosylamine--glycine ligase
MVSAQDHKRVNDGDLGPNTGGMGAYSPAPIVTSDLNKQILENILKPTILALKRMGITYKGVLYAGLMITKDGPKVIEYNCRFGDPETQVILPRLKTDFVNICLAVVQGKLSHLNIEWDERPAACVVMASKGYPGSYSKGIPIDGLETPSLDSDTFIFHAGTTFNGNKVVTSGGRVLSVTGIGTTLDQAVRRAYQTVETIRFQGAHYRKDIAWRAFKKNEP